MQRIKDSGSTIATVVRLLSLPVALAVPAMGSIAAAQTAPAAASSSELSEVGIEDIVVTARRKDEQLQKVPVAISALSGDQLVTRSILKASDLQSSVPGVFSSPGGSRGTNAPIFAIRGQINRDPSATAEAAIGFYFAEVPWGRIQGTNAAFLDLQSVQVLKGPQGTLFGRNSTGGAILISPMAPQPEFGGYVKASLGDYDLRSGEAVLNVPIVETLAVRFAGAREKRDGFLRIIGGRRANDLNNGSLRMSLKWDPSDSFTSTTIGSYFNSTTGSDASRLIGVAPAAPSAGVAGLYARVVDAQRRLLAYGKYQTFSNFTPAAAAVQISGVSQSLDDRMVAHTRTYTIQNKSELKLGELGLLGDVTLKNIVSYRTLTDRNANDSVAVDFLSSISKAYEQMKQVTEEFQVQGKSGPIDYIAGAFYFRERGFDNATVYTIVPVATYVRNKIVNTSYSFFGHANLDLSSVADGLNLTGGVRLNRDRRYWNGMNRRATTPGINSAGQLFTCQLVPTAPANDGSLCVFPNQITFHKPTWDAGINYQAARGSLVYASVARGYRTGGFNQSAASPAVAAPYKPETVTNYEIGAKNDFTIGGMATRLNVAAFYSNYKDIQRSVNFALPSGQLFNLTVNAARANIKGVETELTLKPGNALTLTGAYTYLKPTYDKFTDIYNETTPGFVGRYTVDVSDSQFLLVSRHSFNVAGTYVVPTSDRIGQISLSANYYYRTGFYTTSDINTAHCAVPGDANPAAIYTNCYNHAGKLPGYGLLNARIDWREVLGSRIDAAIFVTNVTNKYYYNNSLNALGTLGTISAQIGAPRMFGASLTARFGE